MRIARPLRWQLLLTAQREKMKMESTNSQSTVSADAGVVAAAARLDYAVDLLCTFLVPIQPYASDDSGAVEAELADPLYSEWESTCTGYPIQPMSRTAEFIHEMAGEIERVVARIRLCKELKPMLDADLPQFAD